jgi:sulfur-carrier protein
MQVAVQFFSYFRDLTGTERVSETVPPGATIEDLLKSLYARFPKLAPMQHSMLIAVGVEYQKPSYLLKEGDEVSLFPPVQGG